MAGDDGKTRSASRAEKAGSRAAAGLVAWRMRLRTPRLRSSWSVRTYPRTAATVASGLRRRCTAALAGPAGRRSPRCPTASASAPSQVVLGEQDRPSWLGHRGWTGTTPTCLCGPFDSPFHHAASRHAGSPRTTAVRSLPDLVRPRVCAPDRLPQRTKSATPVWEGDGRGAHRIPGRKGTPCRATRQGGAGRVEPDHPTRQAGSAPLSSSPRPNRHGGSDCGRPQGVRQTLHPWHGSSRSHRRGASIDAMRSGGGAHRGRRCPRRVQVPARPCVASQPVPGRASPASRTWFSWWVADQARRPANASSRIRRRRSRARPRRAQAVVRPAAWAAVQPSAGRPRPPGSCRPVGPCV